MPTFLSEATINSLLSLGNKSINQNENYEVKVQLLKNASVLSNDEIYTSDKTKTFAEEDREDTSKSVSSGLDDFFVDGNYRYDAIFMPTPVLPNGLGLTNLTSTIFSKKNFKTNKVDQKNINLQYQNIIEIGTFNINGNSVFVSKLGTSLVGKYKIKGNNCTATYTGYMDEYGKNVDYLGQFIKTENGYTCLTKLLEKNKEPVVSALVKFTRECMPSNNINTLTFENHDTYIWYVDEVLKSTQEINLKPTNSENTDNVIYSSREANLFTKCGVNNGVIKLNNFDRFVSNLNIVGTTLITIITSDGILMGNFASERNSLGLTINGTQIKSLANYKSGKYANFISVEIQIDFKDTYRCLTISY